MSMAGWPLSRKTAWGSGFRAGGLWALAGVSLLAGVALTVAARTHELLWGEVAISRALSMLAVGPVETLLIPIDVLFTDVLATVVYLMLAAAVAWRWGFPALVVIGLAGALTAPAKIIDIAARPQPTDDLKWTGAVFGEGGYPSGHVVYAVLVFGTLALLAQRYGGPGRSWTAWLLWGLVGAMGPIRIAQLEHWPADVVAGYLYGATFLALVAVTIPWLEEALPNVSRHRAGASPSASPVGGSPPQPQP
jgi:membrane-associated phospholipid phosphatase